MSRDTNQARLARALVAASDLTYAQALEQVRKAHKDGTLPQSLRAPYTEAIASLLAARVHPGVQSVDTPQSADVVPIFCTTNDNGDIAYFEGHCSPERAVEIVMYWAEKDGWLASDDAFDLVYMLSHVSHIYLDGAALSTGEDEAAIVEVSHPHAKPWTRVRI
jgi:hypothetical protein